MKIQAGRRYLRADGGITGALAENEENNEDFPFRDADHGGYTYTEKGTYWTSGTHEVDLIAEVPEHLLEKLVRDILEFNGLNKEDKTMIYLLISATGEYEDYSETIHGYFKSKEQAESRLTQIKEFDKLIFSKFKGINNPYYDVYDFQRRCYRKFGINAYIDYTGVSWKLQEVKEIQQ